MEKIFEFIEKNYEWIFSGIGVLILTLLLGLFRKSRKSTRIIINNDFNIKNIVNDRHKIELDTKQSIKNGNVHIRKSFNTKDVVDFFEIIGYNTVIRQLDKDKDFIFNELEFYSELNSPKLLVFNATNNKSKYTGVAHIKSVEFNNYSNSNRNLQLGELTWQNIHKIQLSHNHIVYEAKVINNKPLELSLSSLKHGDLTGLNIEPVFLLITVPEEILIQSTDIIIELNWIDFLFSFMIDAKIKKTKKIIWRIKLIPKNNISKKVLKKIRDFLPTDFCWELSGLLDDECFIKMYYYNDIKQKLKVYPEIYSKDDAKGIKLFMQENIDELKENNINFALLDFYNKQ